MIDLTQLGTALGVLGTVGAGVWAWWLKAQKDNARTRADVADANANAAVRDAETTVYELMVNRLKAVEQELSGLRDELTGVRADQVTVRAELAAERAHNRELVVHMWKLETMMRNAGMTVPEFAYATATAKMPGAYVR